MGVESIILWTLVAVSLLGVALMFRGWWGRRIGDHRHCRSCNRDLHGLSSDVERCPECGESSYFFAVGRFERRKVMLATGLLLVFPGLAVLATYSIGSVQGINWIHHQPVWYLVRDLGNSSDFRPSPALNELLRRAKAGNLSNDDFAAITREVLRRQVSDELWHREMGEIVERARTSGALSDADWAQYLFNGSPTILMVRPLNRTGEPVAALIKRMDLKLGNAQGKLVMTIESRRVDDLPVNPPNPSKNSFGNSMTFYVPLLIEDALQPGDHVLKTTVRLDLYPPDSAPGSAPITQKIDLQQAFKVADDAQPFERVTDAVTIARYRERLKPAFYPGIGRQAVEGVRRDAKGQIAIRIPVFAFPSREGASYGLAFDVNVMTNKGEQSLGGFACGPSLSFESYWTANDISPDARELRLILRPSYDRAIRNVEINQWLDAELTFDVPIRDALTTMPAK